jgi:Zn-finger nucleic acid-binding protein
MTERQGVEIDYCPRCRGVWLDRGELDKIIERSSESQPRYANESRSEERGHYEDQKRHEDREHYKQHDDYKYGYKKKKKESFLSDLFDF